MKKKGHKNKLKKSVKGLIVLFFVVLIVGYFFINKGKIKASIVVNNGDFRLTAENKWSQEDRKNYADLNWDKVADLSQSGYQLYQSEDGKTWNNRSLKYGQSIKVLNIYPDEPKSNTLKNWMDGLNLKAKDGSNLIQVTPVAISQYNANPNSFLKDNTGGYKYDVLMFGSWDSNNMKDISKNGAEMTRAYIDTGRGVLFGHDTVNNTRAVFYAHFKDLLGVGKRQTNSITGSAEVQLINNGYLMKYPFEMENDVVLNIPYAHNIELQDKNIGTTWLEFINPTDPWPNPILEDGDWRGGWYLKTNNNVGMIQTGHSNGASSLDERKIIANTLYNLAQVSLNNWAMDQTVKDDKAPDKPNASVRCGKEGQLSVRVDASDKGKKYQWYVEADTKSSGKKKSDVVEEVIMSNIEGYFYELTDSPKSKLKDTVESYKDSYGRIPKEKYDLYVAPDDDSVKYETRSAFTINENKNSEKFLHVLAVDRSDNVSEVSSQQIKDLPQNVNFKVERTKDEGKLIDLNLDRAIDNSMEELEFRTPKNTVIKDFKSLALPANWTAYEPTETAEYKSFTFAIKDKNDLMTITNFINDLRFTIYSPTNQKGEIQVVFHERAQSTTQVNEVTKVCWTEEIPQKVSLKAFDEAGNALTSADLLLDEKITIGKQENITPKNVNFYDFTKLITTEGKQISPLTWTITSEFQQGRLIYVSRKLTVHARQVVTNKNDQVVIPKQGFGVLDSKTELGQKKDEFSLTMISADNNEISFDTFVIRYQIKESLYSFTPKIPMNYELVGYVMTTAKQQHLPSNSTKTPIKVDVSANSEIWLTTYIQPIKEDPSLYHWSYKENNLGKIKAK